MVHAGRIEILSIEVFDQNLIPGRVHCLAESTVREPNLHCLSAEDCGKTLARRSRGTCGSDDVVVIDARIRLDSVSGLSEP